MEPRAPRPPGFVERGGRDGEAVESCSGAAVPAWWSGVECSSCCCCCWWAFWQRCVVFSGGLNYSLCRRQHRGGARARFAPLRSAVAASEGSWHLQGRGSSGRT
jgi:hypothetical protein